MIVLRQKRYSTKTTQAIYKFKTAGNAIKSKVIKGAGKSKTQLAREAINLRESMRPENIKGRAIGAALNTSRKIEDAIYRPGHAANKGIEFAVTKPVAATTYGVWMGKIPYVPGTTSAAIAAETVAQKIPAYKKITGKLGSAWRNSKVAAKLDGITGYDLSKAAQMIPIA